MKINVVFLVIFLFFTQNLIYSFSLIKKSNENNNSKFNQPIISPNSPNNFPSPHPHPHPHPLPPPPPILLPPPPPIIIQGWLKYVELHQLNLNSPITTLNKNNMYYIQSAQTPNLDLSAKDSYGYINIPSDESFYFEVNVNQIKILTSRNLALQRLERVMNLSNLILQNKNEKNKGGVEDLGVFKEGYCFTLNFLVLNKQIIWELCAESVDDKMKWMKTFINLNQRNSVETKVFAVKNGDDVIMTPIQVIRSQKESLNTGGTNPFKKIDDRMKANEEIWEDVVEIAGLKPKEPWSDCNSECGLGVQRRGLVCVQPPCPGPFIEERLCLAQTHAKDCQSTAEIKTKLIAPILNDENWEYSPWSNCSRICDGGIQLIKLKCLSNNCKEQSLISFSRPCNLTPCQHSPISSYLDCPSIEDEAIFIHKNHRIKGKILINMNNLELYSHPKMLLPYQIFELKKIKELTASSSYLKCIKIIDIFGNLIRICPQKKNPEHIFNLIEDYKSRCLPKMSILLDSSKEEQQQNKDTNNDSTTEQKFSINPSECFKNISSSSFIHFYCTNKYPSDLILQKNCQNMSTFCELCCQNETSSDQKEQECCLDQCNRVETTNECKQFFQKLN